MTKIILALVMTSLCMSSLNAQISVSGVSDEEVYGDEVSFEVEIEAGFSYTAKLNGDDVPVGESYSVRFPDYYELEVERESDADGEIESEVIQFIVRSRARGNSEWGLPAFVPLVDVPSASSEFDGSTLAVVTPSVVPAGLDIPLVAFARDGDGERVGVNAQVVLSRIGATDDVTFPLLRGVASTLHAPVDSELAEWHVAAGPLGADVSVAIEQETVWTEISGDVTESVDLGADARLRVVDTLSIAEGVVWSVGAGSVIAFEAGVDWVVNGELRIEGSEDDPILLTPTSRDQPWGGIIVRGESANLIMSHVMLTGSGAEDDWFGSVDNAGSSHRKEQAAVYVRDGSASLESCYLIDNHGQAGHGEDATISMNSCVVQRCATVGQYNRGQVELTNCALLEFPSFDSPFEDDDNDAFYLTGGAHRLDNCLVGWALDDGIDAGSGSAGSVDVVGCWFEACYHEAMAWSEERTATVRDSVAINSGQGIECGFDNPDVDAANCLSTANLVGARFGDNYDWDYEGFLKVSNSLLLFNRRDTWGRNWDDWQVRLDQIDLQGNWVTSANTNFPNNTLWDPAEHATRLEQFIPSSGTIVGVGIATRSTDLEDPVNFEGIPIRLSRFTTVETSIDAVVSVEGEEIARETLTFPPGQSVRRVVLDPSIAAEPAVFLSIENPQGLEITGVARLAFIADLFLIPRGAEWAYSDGGVNEMVAWKDSDFDDSAWARGDAELGYGDDDEGTEIDGGPEDERYPTVYFRKSFDVVDPSAFSSLETRLVRDDGAVVYLNGVEVVRDNMPEGEILYETLAEDTQNGDEEEEFRVAVIDPSLLRAGSNVIAVEVHQAELDSSDVSFNFELVAKYDPDFTGPTDAYFIRADVNRDGEVDVSDPIAGLLYLFDEGEIACEDALDADDNGGLNLTDIVYMLDFLFRGGAQILQPFPEAAADPSEDELGCSA